MRNKSVRSGMPTEGCWRHISDWGLLSECGLCRSGFPSPPLEVRSRISLIFFRRHRSPGAGVDNC